VGKISQRYDVNIPLFLYFHSAILRLPLYVAGNNQYVAELGQANVGQQPSRRINSLMAIVCHPLDVFVIRFRLPSVVRVTGQ